MRQTPLSASSYLNVLGIDVFERDGAGHGSVFGVDAIAGDCSIGTDKTTR